MSTSHINGLRIDGLRINSERLQDEIMHLSHFSDAPSPAVTRILYTPTDLAARAYIKGLLDAAGLPWREDPIGNLFARWEGSQPDLPAVATGSHIDAIPNAGRYDGVVGVLGALEALRSLKDAGFTPRRTLELIVFTAEEPTRFGVGCLGSRALAGVIAAEDLLALRDGSEVEFEAARQAAGYTAPLTDLRIPDHTYMYFVELHIEQGPYLEAAQVPIGVVTDIAAAATIRVTLDGDGGHAGTVLMDERCDALSAAAELALKAEEIARSSDSEDAVATVGIFDVAPRASNSIPHRVQLTIDVRDREARTRNDMMERMRHTLVNDIARRRRIDYEWEVLNADPSARCHSSVIEATIDAANALRLRHQLVVSRAYHDTVFIAQICPVGMIFVPSHQGYSHRPEEYTAPHEIAQGVHVLALTLAQLSATS